MILFVIAAMAFVLLALAWVVYPVAMWLRVRRDHTGRLVTKDIKRRPRRKFVITLARVGTLFTQAWV